MGSLDIEQGTQFNFEQENLLKIPNVEIKPKEKESSSEGQAQNVVKKGKEAKCSKHAKWRNLLAFWILGFCNNFTYWVMITAAYDILAKEAVPANFATRVVAPVASYLTGSAPGEQGTQNFTNGSPLDSQHVVPAVSSDGEQFSWSNYYYWRRVLRECHLTSTGAILIADTLPATVITLSSLLVQRINSSIRVAQIVTFCLASYLCLSFSPAIQLDYVGVVLASISRGLSDITFLGYAAKYERSVLSTWASGTGIATFVGPLLYAGLTTVGLSPRYTLLSMSFIPILISISFWFILTTPEPLTSEVTAKMVEMERIRSDESEENSLKEDQCCEETNNCDTHSYKLIVLWKALRRVLPLAVFFALMYFINQGLLELVYFPGIWLTHQQQYTWNNTLRCLGTLISRSAHNYFIVNNLWSTVGAIFLMAILMLCDAYWCFLPSIWIVFALMLCQGLLEGTAFKSTMYKIYNKTEPRERETSLGLAPISFFFPATIAGFSAIPVHDFLCQLDFT